MLLCMDCGERDLFEREAYGYVKYSETQFINGETEEVDDYHNYEQQDSDETNQDNIKCGHCDSDNIKKGLSEHEKISLIIEHTDKQGKWHQDPLPITEQDKTIFDKHIATKV